MTSTTASLLRKLAASAMVTGALAVSAVIPAERPGQAVDIARDAPQSSPDILHHWPTRAVADATPAILHHWQATGVTTADADPAILHHWWAAGATVADIDPDTLHHWA